MEVVKDLKYAGREDYGRLLDKFWNLGHVNSVSNTSVFTVKFIDPKDELYQEDYFNEAKMSEV